MSYFEIEDHPPIDENTGLPKLPDGYVWQVCERDSSVYPYIIKIVKPETHSFLFSKWVVYEPVRGFDSVFSIGANLVDNAYDAIREGNMQQRATKRREEYEKNLGLYPPKRY